MEGTNDPIKILAMDHVEFPLSAAREFKMYYYEEVRTPCEKLKSLPDAEQYLRSGTTFEWLGAIAYQMRDKEKKETIIIH